MIDVTGRPPNEPGLRVVRPDEKPAPPAKPLTISEAAAAGDDLALAIATRDRIARALESDHTQARDLASLSKRLMELQAQIAALKARTSEEGTGAVQTPDAAFDAAAL